MTNKKETKRKRKKTLFLEAFEKKLGNVSAACRVVIISRETYYRWLEEDSLFAMRCSHIEETNLDFAESVLQKNISEGKEASVFFFLKTKGKKRGYIETTENLVNANLTFLELMKTATSEGNEGS
jgi:hypothetical protein